jgi:transcriptional/translational regulatory protein YebC/TACO1
MSGHSKWSTIKRQKGTADAKRGVAFTKISNQITMAVREGGGGDVDSNFKLRLAVEKAREINMPKDNIARAIEKGLGKNGGAALESAIYEGMDPTGWPLSWKPLQTIKREQQRILEITFPKTAEL